MWPSSGDVMCFPGSSPGGPPSGNISACEPSSQYGLTMTDLVESLRFTNHLLVSLLATGTINQNPEEDALYDSL